LVKLDRNDGAKRPEAKMVLSAQRVLKRQGRLVLVETSNPTMGVGYSIKVGDMGLWSGDSLSEAEQQFTRAVQQR
jgi:hypothetical protein